MKLRCINCNKDVEAELVTGDVIYPHRPDLKNRNFYKCPCHNCIILGQLDRVQNIVKIIDEALNDRD